MKLSVFGPNLNGPAQRIAPFHVHLTDCADCRHYGPGAKHGGDDKGWTIDAPSKMAVVMSVYGPEAGDFEGQPTTATEPHPYLDEFHFAPCCAALPTVSQSQKQSNRSTTTQSNKEQSMKTTTKKQSTPKASIVPAAKAAAVPQPKPQDISVVRTQSPAVITKNSKIVVVKGSTTSTKENTVKKQNEKKPAKKAEKSEKRTAQRADPSVLEDTSRKLKILVTECPKRDGSKAAKKWLAYKNGRTIAEALEKGGTRSDLRWNVAHGFIAIVK